MQVHSDDFEVKTAGKGTYEITEQVSRIVDESSIQSGFVTVFNPHVSASLILFENTDRSARGDLEAAFDRLVPEGKDCFAHPMKGGDLSSALIRTALTRSSETIPIREGAMQLGQYQGIFLFEHRSAPRSRTIQVTVMGGND